MLKFVELLLQTVNLLKTQKGMSRVKTKFKRNEKKSLKYTSE
jgi:hypothetical protein